MTSVHTFSLNGYHIALDVHSGAVHVLDSLSYELLGLLDAGSISAPQCPAALLEQLSSRYSAEEIREAFGELQELWREGLLFSEDTHRPFVSQLGPAPVKSMCLNVAHDCNLRCEYCFAAKGDFGQGRCLMSFDVAKAAIDFLIARSGRRRNLEVDFFGGEPLMNLDVVKQTVAYARSIEKAHGKNFRFTLTTNGLLLNEDSMEFINREMSNVVLSLDGRREINDALRVTAGGRGSYDVIVPKYQALLQGRGNREYYVRGTFTKLNPDFTEDVLHLYRLGFKNLSMEPVVLDEALPWAITGEDLPAIFAEYERLALEILKLKQAGEPITFFHFMLDLTGGPCAVKRLRGCSCGNEYVAVTPEGDIYPCHQFVGMKEWKMGNLTEGTFDEEKQRFFSTAHIYNKPECQSCWAKFFCSGGCNANNEQFAGNVMNPYPISCALEKKRLECAVMMQAALADAP